MASGRAQDEPLRAALRALQALPGVGPSIAQDLLDLGFRRPEDLRGRDPEALYSGLAALRGSHQDRCLLYVFRCAVHVAEHPDAPAPLRLWWNWKDPSGSSAECRKKKPKG